MRVFKHGDALAIVFPQSAVASSGLKEGEELEFIETEKGVFVLLRKEKLAELASRKVEGVFTKDFDKPVGEKSPSSSFGSSSSSSGLKAFFKRELESKGFVIVFAESGAKDVSEEMATELKSGEVLGTRGFDKRYYLATRQFIARHAAKILNALKEGPSSTVQIAEKTRLPQDAATALVCLLMEQGEIIEKKKGFFAPA